MKTVDVTSFSLVGWSSAQCSGQQWLHVPVLFLEAFGRISNIFYVLVFSDPAIDSRPALRGVLTLVIQSTV